MSNQAAIKARIKSINTTKKITSAMQLISTVKLQKYRNLAYKTISYESEIENCIKRILNSNFDLECSYLKENDINNKLFIIFCSDMGMCGAYNNNLLKLILKEVKKDDYIFLIGGKIYNQLKRYNYNILNDYLNSDKIDYHELNKISKQAIAMFDDKKISSINVIYTKFKNNVSFNEDIKQILPIKIEKKDIHYPEVLYEPNSNEVLNDLIPLLLESLIYRLFIESKTCEHGSRRFAMENATNNADELNEKLLLEFNQARQASITSEITEIVAGADAL